MKVYLIVHYYYEPGNYNGDDIKGIFDSTKKALDALNTYGKENETEWENWTEKEGLFSDPSNSPLENYKYAIVEVEMNSLV